MPLGGNVLAYTTRIDNKKMVQDAKKTESVVGSMTKKISSFLTGPGGMAAAGAVVVMAFKKIVDVNIQFEKSLSGLQSILGLTNEEMKFYRDESVRLGSTTTQTSVQVAEAFKLIGSQKPELLANKEALSKVTEQAIILSEAAGIDVPTAAKALTGSLNQMGASAQESGNYINILAAGSKVGAASIPYLNKAIEKSGAVARDANLSFEQLVGALETIAPSISEPSTAGLQFKNVLLELQKAGYGFESGQFDLKDALNEVNTELENIEDPAKKAAKEMEIFGKISLVAGKALIKNIDGYENYTQAVTGTNTALEQQAINTNNLQGSIDKFKSALEGLMLSFNEEGGLTGALQSIVDVAIKVIQNFDVIGEIFEFLLEPLKEMFGVLFELAESLGLVTDTGDAVGKIMKILTTTTKIAMLPMRMLFQAITLISKGIIFLIARIKWFIKSNETAQKVVKKVQEVIQKLKERFEELLKPLKPVIDAIKQFHGLAGEDVDVSGLKKVESSAKESLRTFIGLNNEATALFTNLLGGVHEKMAELSKLPPELQQKINDLRKNIAKAQPVSIIASQDADEVIATANDIEKLKIEAMQDGIEKRIALVKFETTERLNLYREKGILTSEIEKQIEAEKNIAIAKIQDDFLNETAQKILEIENLKISYMIEGIDKRLIEINKEYDQKLLALDKFNLTEQEKIDLQTQILAEKQFAIDEAERQHQQNILDEEKTNFEKEIALENSKVALLDLSEQEKRAIEIESQILRLEAQKQFSLNMTEIEEQTINNQILAQKKLLNELNKNKKDYSEIFTSMGNSIESFGAKWIAINKDEAKSQKEKSKAIKSALLDETQIVISAAVVKYVAATLGTMAPPFSLIFAPLAAVAVMALFAGLKSSLGFEKGGIVPGTSYSGDKIYARLNSGEMVSNQQQKDNLLMAIANGGSLKSDNMLITNELLKEQNQLLKNKVSSVVYQNQLLQIKNGQITGAKTYLS